MKKILIIFLMFFITFIFSQNYRVVYELKYKRDSLKENYDTQYMVLDIDRKESKFYYAKLLKLDSLSKKGINVNVSFPLQQIIKKQKGSSIFTNYYSIDGQYFQYNTKDEMTWQIQNNTKQTPNGMLQKAKTSFGGRTWEAWFFNDTPLQEGPFKFSGLPGLIFEIQDNKNNFIYKLISIAKQNSEFDTKNIVETNLGIKPLEVSEKQFKKMLYDKYLNPYSEFENMSDGSWGFQYGEKYITTKKELQDIKKERQKQIRENNNPIELDKALNYK